MMKSYRIRFLFVALLATILAGCSAESKKLRLLERAAGYYKAGDLEKARIEYQNVLQRHPDDAVANEGLGLIWHERGATARALTYLSKATSVAPGNGDVRLKRAQLLAQVGRVAEARREAADMVARSPNVTEALVLLTETVRDADDIKAADQALLNFPRKETVSFHIASANLLNLRNDRVKAKAALDRALAVDAQSPAAHSAMAGLLAVQNKPVEALEEHKRAAELAPLRSRYRLQHAGYLAQTGKVPEAIASLKEIVRQVPDYQAAWRALGQIALAEKRFDDCIGFLKEALARDAADYEALVLHARVSLVKGDAKRVVEELKKVGESFTGLGLEKHDLALAYLQLNEPANALATLQQVVAQYPDNLDAAILYAQLSLRAGAPEPAATVLAGVINRRPDLLPPYLLLIEASKALGKLDNLIGALAKNLVTAPKNVTLHYVLGVAYARQDKFAESRQSFERAIAVAPDYTPALIDLINLDLKDGSHSAAVQKARELGTKNPKSAIPRVLLAKAHAAQKNWPEAEAAALEAIGLEPNQNEAYGLLVQSFTARKNEPGITGKLEGFLAKNPNEHFATRVGAQVYIEMKEYGKARDLYEKFLAANPNATLVMNNLANLYSDQLNQPDRALELARKARALEPAAAPIADTLGWILFQRKEYPEALALLEESAKSLPAEPEVQFHLGMVNRAMNRNEAALAAFRVVANSPADYVGKAEAKRHVAELEKLVPASGPSPAPADQPKAK